MTTVRSFRRRRIRVGRVSLYQHHGAWWLYYREGGNAHRKRVGADRLNAERIAAEVNAQLTNSAPSLFSFTPVTLPELASRWLAHHEGGRGSSFATVSRYRTAVQHLLDFESSSGQCRPAHEVSADGFVIYLRSIAVSSNGHPNSARRHLMANGIRFIVETCRAMFNYAATRRLVPPYFRNPFSMIAAEARWAADAKQIFVFSPQQAGRFLDACDEWQFAIFFTLATTGLRSGELTHLLVEDVDLDTKELVVRNRPGLGWQIKTRNERRIPIYDELIAVLTAMLRERRTGLLFRRRRFFAQGQISSGAGVEDPPLGTLDAAQLTEIVKQRARVPGSHPTHRQIHQAAKSVWHDAGVIRATRIREEFITIAKRVGLDVSTPKSWRHTFATRMQDAGVDPLIRQQVMGHAPPAGRPSAGLGMTALYTHTQPETYRAQIRRTLELMREVLAAARDRLGNASCACAPSSLGEVR